MEIQKGYVSKITTMTLATEPSLRHTDQGSILLAQGSLHGHLQPGEEVDLTTDDRRSCDGLLLLTIQEGETADYTFVHLVQDDPHRQAAIQLVHDAIAAHPQGTRIAILVTSHSFTSGTVLQGSDAVFGKLASALKKFVGKGRVEIRAVDPEFANPSTPYELSFRRKRQSDGLSYQLSITNTDLLLNFSPGQAQEIASQPGATKRIPEVWD